MKIDGRKYIVMKFWDDTWLERLNSLRVRLELEEAIRNMDDGRAEYTVSRLGRIKYCKRY